MLTRALSSKRPGRQSGVVLIIALIVLVAMTLAGISLMRSVDNNNNIPGKNAFKQAAKRTGDAGVEAAIAFLSGASSATLEADRPGNGYAANGSAPALSPAAGQSWDAFWVATMAARKVNLSAGAADEAGNKISYVIDRMCNNSGGKTSGASCTASPVVTAATGNNENQEIQLNAPSVVYYRITVRVVGPRNTVSYVQAIAAL
jgi:type IV pilus assembly protein PilX